MAISSDIAFSRSRLAGNVPWQRTFIVALVVALGEFDHQLPGAPEESTLQNLMGLPAQADGQLKEMP